MGMQNRKAAAKLARLLNSNIDHDREIPLIRPIVDLDAEHKRVQLHLAIPNRPDERFVFRFDPGNAAALADALNDAAGLIDPTLF